MSDTVTGAPAPAEAVSSEVPEASEVVDSSNEGAELEASAEELEDIVDDPSSTEQEKKEAAKQLKKILKVKVNGKEVEREIDFDNDDYLREMIQKGEGADQKFQESAALRKQMEAFVQLMQRDPLKALEKLGHNPDEWAEKHIQKRLEEMQKSPEQIEREKLQAELEEMKREKEEFEKQKFTAEQQRIQDEYSRQLDQEITEGLASSDLPKSPYVVKRVAELLMLGISKGKDVSVKDVLPLAERQIKAEIQQMFAAMPEDLVEKVLGQDVATKLRKRRISKMKPTAPTAADVKPTGNSEIKQAQKQKDEVKPLPSKDFFKKIGDY